MENKKRIVFIVNHDVVIYNFRKELVEKLLTLGHEVFIISPNGEKLDILIAMGCEHVEIDVNRHGINPVEDIKLFNSYARALKKIRPDIVFTYTIKPNIYG
ncbi:MAG: glycosyltransferase, partial [Enterococcus devriesei]|uniref:glycosyltransferase n=1 Tax=Enterococcus devriesei TaxID=319970 RepID=UPI003F8F6196